MTGLALKGGSNTATGTHVACMPHGRADGTPIDNQVCFEEDFATNFLRSAKLKENEDLFVDVLVGVRFYEGVKTLSGASDLLLGVTRRYSHFGSLRRLSRWTFNMLQPICPGKWNWF
ncbi:MAG: hypothetical protein PHV43_01215 [Candidatus Colwellbacteria bacterium]|nr:hypothetical protein [Candidatus Colwellbacteria bacterium]